MAPVKFVLPYKGSCFVYDESLCNRSCFLPEGYVFSVKVYENQFLNVKRCCQTGTCTCVYYLDGIPSPLKPCRIAALMAEKYMFSDEDSFVLSGVCRGFRIVDDDVDLHYSVGNYKSILNEDMYNQMCEIIVKELAKGQVSRLDKPATCVHALGAVVRPNGKLRPITDCSRPQKSVNNYMTATAKRFKFSHVEDTRHLVTERGYGGTVDLSNAYRSVLIYPPHREFVGFNWVRDGKTLHFCDNSLCFGLKSAPSIFNSISGFVTRYMALSNVECLSYLDDYFVAGPDLASCTLRQAALLKVLTRVGFSVNYDKVSWPSQCPKYLGVMVDLVDMKFRLPKEKISKTLDLVRSALDCRWYSYKKLERLTGLLAHCATLVKGGRTFCRRLYSLLKACHGKRRVRFSDLYKRDLYWWSSFLKVFDGTCEIFPPLTPAHHVFTDASGTGFGAWYLEDYIFGFWGENNYCCSHLSPTPVFDKVTDSNINVKELWPVLAAVRKWGKCWKGSYVLLHTDNTQVLSMVASGRSRNIQAMQMLRELFWCCSVLKIDLRAMYIPTDVNLFADRLSRLPSTISSDVIYGLPLRFRNCCIHRKPETT